jgi:hypothetical protein
MRDCSWRILLLGPLSAGHKLDVVLTPELSSNQRGVALYGWHRPSNTGLVGRDSCEEAPFLFWGVRRHPARQQNRNPLGSNLLSLDAFCRASVKRSPRPAVP